MQRTKLGTVLVSAFAGMIAGSTIAAPEIAQAGPTDQPHQVRKLVGITTDNATGILYRAWDDGVVEYNPWIDPNQAPSWQLVPVR